MGTQCIQCGIGSRPKFQDINLERLTGLKRLYVGPISRLPGQNETESCLNALRDTLRSWRPVMTGNMEEAVLQLRISAMPISEYEQDLDASLWTDRPCTRKEFCHYLEDFGRAVEDGCSRTSPQWLVYPLFQNLILTPHSRYSDYLY